MAAEFADDTRPEPASRDPLTSGAATGDGYFEACELFAAAFARIVRTDRGQAAELAGRVLDILGTADAGHDDRNRWRTAHRLVRVTRSADGSGAPGPLSQRHDNPGWYHAAKARTRLLDGRWDEALVEVAAGLKHRAGSELTAGLRGIADIVRVRRGVATLFRAETVNVPDYLRCWADALALETGGDVAGALAILRDVRGWEPGAPARLVPPHVLYADLARLAHSLGEAEQLVRIADAMPAPRGADCAASIGATADLCRGFATADVALLGRSVDGFSTANWPLHKGIAFEGLAMVSAAAGDRSRARQASCGAQAVYQELGAVWDMARAASSLREYGIQRGVRGKRRNVDSGWDALTDTERWIAVLVSDGLSNPDIAVRMYLSPRTVQSHVSSILRKLGLASRVQVAAEMVRRTVGHTG